MSTSCDDDVRWLLGDAAAPYLAAACTSPLDELSLATHLRKRLSPERSRLVVEQAVLRRRGRVKFAAADRMYFTPLGLEQATDDVTARYKAARFESDAKIVDFCCGIGGDLTASAARGPALGIDRSPTAALFAEANCRAVGVRAVIRIGEVTPNAAAECDAWHIDPDRRSTGRRTTEVGRFEPDGATMDRLLSVNGNAAIKLAPATEPPMAWRDRAEWEWISLGGECKQLVGWFGNLTAQPGTRRATALSIDGMSRTFVGKPHAPMPDVAEFGKYLFDPDAAVLAADLLGALAEQYQIAAVHPGCVYLTGDEPRLDPLLQTFEIVETLPFDLRKLRARLAELKVGRLEIKKRGIEGDPARLRRELQLRGDAELCLILVRRGDRVTAVLARRIPPLPAP